MVEKAEVKEMSLNGHRKKVSFVRATQERTGILYSEQRYLSSPKAVVDTFGKLFENAGVEYCVAVALTKKAEPVAIQVIGIGGLDSAVVSIPDILRFVLLSNSNSLILLHNHPSGNPRASYEDVMITEKIEKACKMMDIELLDHVIIGDVGCGYSCKEEKLIYTEDYADKLAKGA